MKLQTHAKGFTLVELVVIIVLIGVLSAVILPRLSLRSSFDDRVFNDELINIARFAQQLAMMRGRGYTVRYHINNAQSHYGIQIQQGAGAFNWITHPNTESFPINYPSGLTTAPNNIVIVFDALGNVVGNVSQTITITGAGSATICIENSGFARKGGC